jgi:hypothetical protein
MRTDVAGDSVLFRQGITSLILQLLLAEADAVLRG